MDPQILERERTKRRITKENECMAMADHVVTISESMRKVLVERGVPAGKIDVVPNAIDAANFEAVGEPVMLPALAGAGLVIGYVSNMSNREGHRHLIEALALLRASGLDARCLLVGDGPERQALQELAATLRVSDVTVFTGEVDHRQINAYYRAIDVFVVPRVPDYAADWVTPLKPFEAMALGRPLVVTDLPALREVVGDGERGRIARPGDSASLCREILLLANAPELAAETAANARRWVFEHRSWEANARRYRDIYQRVIDRYRSRSEARKGP
jgi:glycosyltransferase involved in cell wall biosynthesis